MAKDVIKKKYDSDPESYTPKKWWLFDDRENLFNDVFSMAKWIQEQQSYRTTAYLRYARLYQNQEMFGLQAHDFARIQEVKNLLTNRVTMNIIRSVVTTSVAHIGTNQPRPYFLTEGGTYKQKQKAKLLTQYGDGTFDKMKFRGKAKNVFRDSGVFGTGFMKFYAENGQVECERTMPAELLVDDIDGLHGEPRTLYHVKNIDREVLCGRYPKEKIKLINAKNTMGKGEGIISVADMVTVVEAWHLPSSKGAKDGRHVIAADNVTLHDSVWENDYFPFVSFKWESNILGFYGTGLAEQLIGIQLEINKLLRTIQRAMHLQAVPRVFLENGSTVSKAHLTNSTSGIIPYTGTPPIFSTPAAITPQVFEHIEYLWGKGYEETGVSQMQASSQTPAGVDSAVGMRTLNAVGNARFADKEQAWEDFHIDSMKMILDIQKEIVKNAKEGDEEPYIKYEKNEVMKKIKWSDVNIPEDDYILRCFPTGILPSEPAGKLQTATEFIQAGFYDQDEAMELLDFPDLKETNSFKLSSHNIIKKIMWQIIDEGKYTSPEPFMDLEKARSISQNAYLYAEVENVEESRLDLLREFQQQVSDLLEAQAAEQMAKQQAAMPAPPPMGDPMGDPMAPPMEQPIEEMPMQPELPIGA